MMDRPRQWIIVYGSVATGLCFVGPFHDPADILEYVKECGLTGWEAVEMDHPDDIEEEKT